MNSLRLYLYIFLASFASVSSRGGDPLIRHIYGDAGVVLNDALEAAIEGDLDLIKHSLSPAYLKIVSAAELETSLSRSDWKFEKFTILSTYKFEGFRCFVVDFSFYARIGDERIRYHSTDPTFVKLEGEEWKLWNFPFAPSIARNFPKERFCLSPEK